jgi:rubrerythrin
MMVTFWLRIIIKGGKTMSADKPKAPGSEMGGKGGFHGEEGGNIFSCPECDYEHAFPGQDPNKPPQCPKCAIPMKSKYVSD